MKLLLTSTGLATETITNAFLELINKPIKETRVLFVPTAARTNEELNYAELSKQQLQKIGILKKNIQVINLDKPLKIKEFDVIYICGGNTFFLLKKIKESGFDKIIKDSILENKIYFGVSAGSMILSPNIELAIPFDKNDIKLKDLSGLKVINVYPSPHYIEKEKPLINKYINKYKVITLTDNQALLITKNLLKII